MSLHTIIVTVIVVAAMVLLLLLAWYGGEHAPGRLDKTSTGPDAENESTDAQG